MLRFAIPAVSDMPDFDQDAYILGAGNIFHLSSSLSEMFAIETKTTVVYKTPDLGEKSYVSSEMTDPILASEIVHYAVYQAEEGEIAGFVWFRAVVDGLSCFVQIDPTEPGLVRFMQTDAGTWQFGS